MAQDSTKVPRGSLVELRARNLLVESMRGRAVALDTNGVRLAVTRAGSTVFVPWENVSALRWATPRSRARGARDGALIGVLLGTMLFLNGYPWGAPAEIQDSIRTKRLIVSGTVAGASTLIGFVAGARKWSGLPITRSTRASVALDFKPQDVVRIESTLGRFVGHSVVSGDSLRMVTSQGPVTLAWRNVGDLQAHAGRNRLLGILYGAAVGYAVSSVSNGYMDVSNGAWAANIAAGGVLGFRYLSPTGWTSLPQPNR